MPGSGRLPARQRPASRSRRRPIANPQATTADLTQAIIGAAIEVHRELGPGLLESAYEACLHFELRTLGLHVLRQVSLPLIYKGNEIDLGYRIDLLVENNVVVELKAINKIDPIHQAQLLSYLKLSRRRVGLIINFNVACLKDGIKRLVL